MSSDLKNIVKIALKEDLGAGDRTTKAIVAPGWKASGTFVAKQGGIVAGLELAKIVFQTLDPKIQFRLYRHDGDPVSSGDVLASCTGTAKALLEGERTALNFLQRLSGIATLTHQFVQAVKGTGVQILDTRKTAPGLRVLDKWAVQCGGGKNHRFGLYDAILIKNNHIAMAQGVTVAIQKAKKRWGKKYPIIVEVRDQEELMEALKLMPERILLDNMSLVDLRKSVRAVAKRVPLEASGSVTLDTVWPVAKTGVDFISVGCLTHSVQAFDLHFTIKELS